MWALTRGRAAVILAVLKPWTYTVIGTCALLEKCIIWLNCSKFWSHYYSALFTPIKIYNVDLHATIERVYIQCIIVMLYSERYTCWCSLSLWTDAINRCNNNSDRKSSEQTSFKTVSPYFHFLKSRFSVWNQSKLPMLNSCTVDQFELLLIGLIIVTINGKL